MRVSSFVARCAGLVLLAVLPLASAQSAGGDRELGKHLSAECVTCHQVTGRITAGIPAIISLPEDQFIAMMNGYRDKVRDNQVMQTIAVKFKDEEISALAAYFGSLKKR